MSSTSALYLEKINTSLLKNTRIAYYPGSFDPPHLGHSMAIKAVLSRGLVDYVLVYALPDSDTSKKRTPFALRFAMLEDIYNNHPKILITKLNPGEMQEKLWPLFKDIQFSVILGSDVINQYVRTVEYDEIWMKGISIKQAMPEHMNTSTGAIMAIPANRVIAFNRVGDDLSYIGRIYKNRPITILTSPDNVGLSSTEVRLAIKEGKCLTGMLSSQVEAIIRENGLYKD